jgi:hypothetical protein
MTDRECNFVNSNQAKRSLDPWCTSHERSAICCVRALREENARLREDLQEARDLIPPDVATSNTSVYGKLREARATIARVEALADEWAGAGPVCWSCSQWQSTPTSQLRTALKGKP